jgi:hypothetical protein
MIVDVVFHEFHHQTIDTSSCSGGALKHTGAGSVLVQHTQHEFELADHFLCSVHEVRLFSREM